MKKCELNIIVKRIKNSTYGNPNFEVTQYDNREAIEYLIKEKMLFVNSKGKIRTKSNIALSYGLLNKQGAIFKNCIIFSNLQ